MSQRVVAVVGIALGFAGGAIANYFILRPLLASVEWHAVLFAELAFGMALTVVAIRRSRRRGPDLAAGALAGVTLSIAAYWALLFWVVM